MSQDDFEARRRRRAHWAVRVCRRGEEAVGCGDATPEQRIAMMWELAVQAWTLAGLPIPDYDRAHTPVRVLRRGEEE